jgi:flagellar biosynthetic protein FliP
MTAQTTSEATIAGTAAGAERARSPRRAFLLHLGEMLLAMALGMVVLGGAVEGVLRLAGSSLTDAPASIQAAVMAFDMTAPMVWWMQRRGHPARHSVEMAASMVVPSAFAIALHWLDLVSADAVLVIQHELMIPAMVAAMLWRHDHYSR